MTAGAVVFDLDGTLIDSAPDIHAAVTGILSEEGQAPLPLATVRSFIGNGVPTLIDRVTKAAALDPARRADRIANFLARYEAASAVLTRPYPGVPEALTELRGAGLTLGLCTNKPVAATNGILAAFGLQGHFAAVIGGDSLPTTKPDPAGVHLCLSRMGCESAVYVGDSEVDCETAARAGLPFLLFTEGYRRTPTSGLPHAATFSDFHDLPGLVIRLLAAAEA